MMRYSDVAVAVNGKLLGADGVLQGVSHDTRTLSAGEMYVALEGQNFDGHDFIAKAVELGADAVMENRESEVAVSQIVASDTRIALGQMAAAWRQQYDIPFLAITGSNGKTTVKEMTASILSQSHKVLSTRGNLNNDIGVPLTLLKVNKEHQCAVIEMGANHPGEIQYLTDMVKPTAALVNNAGASHLEGFGSIEGVARAKAEIYSGLDAQGVAVINADDAYADIWRQQAKNYRCLEFSLAQHQNADVVGRLSDGVLLMQTPVGEIELTLPLPGEHNARNALAAATLAITAGASKEDIKVGLESMQAVSGRLQAQKGICGVTVINDAYNANPASLLAALQTLATSGKEIWLALGSMGELGSTSEALHQEMGECARKLGVSKMFTLGEHARLAADAFGEGGISAATHDALLASIKSSGLHDGVTILVKGSRAMRMENIVAGLLVEGSQQSVGLSEEGQ